MTSSEWIGLENLQWRLFAIIVFTLHHAGLDQSRPVEVYEYPPQLYNILFSSASFVFAMWHYCAIVPVFAVWHRCILYHRLRIYRLTAEMAKLPCSSFKLPSPFNCFTQEDLFFSIAADENIYDLGPFQFNFWGKYCVILVQHGFISYGVADKRRNKLFNQNKINPHGFLQAVYCSPKSLFAVVCSF